MEEARAEEMAFSCVSMVRGIAWFRTIQSIIALVHLQNENDRRDLELSPKAGRSLPRVHLATISG